MATRNQVMVVRKGQPTHTLQIKQDKGGHRNKGGMDGLPFSEQNDLDVGELKTCSLNRMLEKLRSIWRLICDREDKLDPPKKMDRKIPADLLEVITYLNTMTFKPLHLQPEIDPIIREQIISVATRYVEKFEKLHERWRVRLRQEALEEDRKYDRMRDELLELLAAADRREPVDLKQDHLLMAHRLRKMRSISRAHFDRIQELHLEVVRVKVLEKRIQCLLEKVEELREVSIREGDRFEIDSEQFGFVIELYSLGRISRKDAFHFRESYLRTWARDRAMQLGTQIEEEFDQRFFGHVARADRSWKCMSRGYRRAHRGWGDWRDSARRRYWRNERRGMFRN